MPFNFSISFHRKRKIKKNNLPTPRMQETQKLVEKGFSIKEAMRQAGYSEKTIAHRWRDYFDKLDLEELIRGLKTGTAVFHYEVLKVLSDILKSDDVKDQLKAADIGTRLGKVHLNDQDQIKPKLTIVLQTIDKQLVIEGDTEEQIDEEY